jgi:prolyl 4-hydroxylase
MGMYVGHFDFTHPLVWTVPDFFTAAECAAVLDDVASAEWLLATVNREQGRAVDARLRDNTVAILRDRSRSEDLFRRVRPHVPERMSAELGGDGRVVMEATGVHLPLRVYRYEPGQHFGPHQDQSYFGPNGEKSLLTLMVYLNEGFEGGETEFPEQGQTIVPRTGTALLFQHMVLHAGNRVAQGTKLVLRSDVLYRRV